MSPRVRAECADGLVNITLELELWISWVQSVMTRHVIIQNQLSDVVTIAKCT